MNNFRGKHLTGEWWEPSRPELRYKGSLELDEKNHGTLTLRGSESHLCNLPLDPKPRTFFGKLTNNYTYEVTLLRAGMKQGPGRSSSKATDRDTHAEFFTNEVVVGWCVESDEVPLVHGALVDLTGLEEWCDACGISGEQTFDGADDLSSGHVDVQFRSKTSPHYDLGESRQIRFVSEYDGPFFFNSKCVTLKERNTIELLFPEPLSIKQMLSEIHIWQTFITFGVRRPSYIRETMLLVQAGGESFTRVGLMVPGRRPEPSKENRFNRDVLFNQSKLGPKLGASLRAWRQNFATIDIAILLFSGAAYQDAVYVHTNLLTYLQALEIFHRDSFKVDRFATPEDRKSTMAALRNAIPSTLDSTLRAALSEQLGHLGNPTLADRLKALFDKYPESAGPLFPNGYADIMQLKDVRNFLTHYGDQKSFGKTFLWSRNIFLLKERARLFLEICLLGALGLSDAEIHELLEQFDPYVYGRYERWTESDD